MIVGSTNDLQRRKEATMNPPPAPPFSPRLIGQTEKALNAILARLLAGTGLTEPQWVVLTVAVMGGVAESDQFAARVADALKLNGSDAHAMVTSLVTDGFLEVANGRVKATPMGQELQTRVRTSVGQITERLWGDVPAEDLATAGRVLAGVLSRANAELANA
jgi:DNA-binding MarR family transcriptional regulator